MQPRTVQPQVQSPTVHPQVKAPTTHPHSHHPGRPSPRPRRATQTRGARQAGADQLRPRPRRILHRPVGRRRQDHHRRQQRDRRATAEQHRPVHDQLVDNRMTPSTNQHPPLPNPGTRRPRRPQRTRTAERTTSSRSPTRDCSADQRANHGHPRQAPTSSRRASTTSVDLEPAPADLDPTTAPGRVRHTADADDGTDSGSKPITTPPQSEPLDLDPSAQERGASTTNSGSRAARTPIRSLRIPNPSHNHTLITPVPTTPSRRPPDHGDQLRSRQDRAAVAAINPASPTRKSQADQSPLAQNRPRFEENRSRRGPRERPPTSTVRSKLQAQLAGAPAKPLEFLAEPVTDSRPRTTINTSLSDQNFQQRSAAARGTSSKSDQPLKSENRRPPNQSDRNLQCRRAATGTRPRSFG